MQILSDEEFLKLKASGLGAEELPVKTIQYNNVDLNFHQQPPGKVVELLLSIGEAMKESKAIALTVEAYFPQLKGNFSQLNAFSAVEIVMLILQQSTPGEVDLPNLATIN
jgi:hypothetical protein